MLIRHISAGFAAFICASFVVAEDVRLTAEIPLAPQVVPIPAPGEQRFVRVASAGRDFLAVWRDGDEYRAMRIDADGHSAEPNGHLLAGVKARYGPIHLASDGFSYLVVWSDSQGSHSLVLDEHGQPFSAIQDFPIREATAVHSNGSTYLVLSSDLPRTAALLDRNGRVLRTFTLAIPGYPTASVSVAPDGAYHLVRADVSQVLLDRITDDASAPERVFRRGLHTTTVGERSPANVSAAASPDGILLTWRNSPTADINIALLDFDGAVLNRTRVYAAPGLNTSAVWDGRQFFVTTLGNGRLYGARVQPDGTPVDGVALVLSTTAESLPSYASNGTTHLLAWEDKRFSPQVDIVARTFDGFDVLPYDPRTFRLLSAAPDVQHNPRIARAGPHELVAWTDQYGKVFGTLNGRRLGLPDTGAVDPEVTPGAINFLLTWIETHGATRSVVGVRIDFDGRVLDREPVVLIDKAGWFGDHAVAYGRTNFFIAARADASIATVHLTERWGAFNRADITMQKTVREISALWNGEQFVILWTDDHDLYSAQDGGRASALLYDIPFSGWPVNFAATAAPDRLTIFIYKNAAESAIVQASPDGTRVLSRTSLPIPRNLVLSEPQLVRIGAEYVLGWTQGAFESLRVRALRIDTEGTAIDPEPFDVAAMTRLSSLAATPEGAKFAYTRNVGGSLWTRIFTRTLLRGE